jgi:uncharacterized membrane protein
MDKNDERLNQIFEKLDILLRRQNVISEEINGLREEIYRLKEAQTEEHLSGLKAITKDQPAAEIDKETEEERPITTRHELREERTTEWYTESKTFIPPREKSVTEKFIGENLINKIGIVITVIGVFIGAKYSIEHDLISPLTRIILGYLMGLGLLGFGIKLKKDYENYSAVLVSGAMAIFYFITYAAYSFYDLMPQTVAFVLMVIFTAFTVIAAINYNRQVIAHIGLVGAYAIPFLLSKDSGRVDILFSYIAIINLGILFIAHKKYWKSVYYSSFLITWLIFFSWFSKSYKPDEDFGLCLTFLSVFFVTFYLILLDYKLLQKEKFDAGDIILLLANSFIFYGIGYSILKTNSSGEQLLGIFTLCNAIVHFGVSVLIYRQKLADINLFYLVAGLVLTFITIAIPIQLNGNWVTMLWACEAALLFWIGRIRNVSFYELLSYVLMFLAFISIIQDWSTLYNSYNPDKPETRLIPFFNMNFVTSAILVASFAFINYLNFKRKLASPIIQNLELKSIINFSIPAILIIAIYFSFRMEISTYWNQLYTDSEMKFISNSRNLDLLKFKTIWLINYSLLFLAVLSYVNNRKIRNFNLGKISIYLMTFLMLIFLSIGLYTLSELRESYLNQAQALYYQRGPFNIGIRYISFAFAGVMLISLYQTIHQEYIKPVSVNLKVGFDLVLYTTLLWISSSELITWMDVMKFQQSYKLGLSILWGIYALILIVLGIWERKKHLRISAIALFALTLLKLFLYDLSFLDTISKTIVFVSLGILLLIISFLYNKYKHLISEEND